VGWFSKCLPSVRPTGFLTRCWPTGISPGCGSKEVRSTRRSVIRSARLGVAERVAKLVAERGARRGDVVDRVAYATQIVQIPGAGWTAVHSLNDPRFAELDAVAGSVRSSRRLPSP